MTPEQRKRVAEEVTGLHAEAASDGTVQLYQWIGPAPYPKDRIRRGAFIPLFSGQDWQRSQALAVVEWIIDNLPPIDVNEDCAIPAEDMRNYQLQTKFGYAFKRRDIDCLQSVVLELCDDR